MTNRRFRFGVVAGYARTADEWVVTARRAESLGYSTFLTPDTVRNAATPAGARDGGHRDHVDPLSAPTSWPRPNGVRSSSTGRLAWTGLPLRAPFRAGPRHRPPRREG